GGEWKRRGRGQWAGSRISKGGSSSFFVSCMGLGRPQSGRLTLTPMTACVLQYAPKHGIVHGRRGGCQENFTQLHPLFTPPAANRRGPRRGRRRSPRPSTSGQMPKILLAEDDTDMRRFLVLALQNAAYEVSSSDNGLSAYQRLREEPFELLLTDIVMPEMDGIELARRASELDPDIKIMFITGFAAVALNSDSQAPKNAKVLSKPVHLRELVTEVQKMLAA